MDTATEQLIQIALARLMAGRTSFVIAQRMSTVRLADQIIVLEKGRIAAQGSHQELLAHVGVVRTVAIYQQFKPQGTGLILKLDEISMELFRSARLAHGSGRAWRVEGFGKRARRPCL